MNEQIALFRIRNHSLFGELIDRRRKFVTILTAATLVPYYSFVLIASFHPNLLAFRLSESSSINIGWLAGLALIGGTWLLTGLYICRANGQFDAMTKEILEGAKK